MKTSARFLAMLLAVVMIAGAALSATAFDDVAGNKHANAVNVLAQLGVIGGYEDGTFKPDQKVTRAEMAKLAYVLYTTFVDAGTAKTAFADVADDHWATGYINWCSQQGIIGGYGDGKFGPNDNVTYDQALKMVCGVLGYTDFQSNLWPTDVRMQALRTLNLGTDLEDVKGDAQLTRAQVAQIMYNALTADMKETKIEYVYDNNSYTDKNGDPIQVKVPMEVAKSLAVDVWGYKEVAYKVVGTENYGTKTNVEDAIKLEGETSTTDLADLGLEKYEGKTDALIGLTIVTLVDTDKDEMLGVATVAGSVFDNVEITYNKAKTVLTVNGVDYKDEKVDADELQLIALEETDLAAAKVFVADAEDAEKIVINPAIIEAVNAPYVARAIDADGDGEVDSIIIAKVSFATVTDVKKEKVTLDVFKGEMKDGDVEIADLTIAVEEEDVIAIANLGGILYAEVIEGIETKVTKLAAADNKVTLANVGVVEYADGVINEANDKIYTENNVYYIYDGEVVLSTVAGTSSEYAIAILKDIVKKDEVINPVTFKKEIAYVATLIENGVEKEVVLAENAIVGAKDYTAAAAYTEFGSEFNSEEGATVVYDYTIVATYEETDKGVVLTIGEKLDEDDILVAKGEKISYNAKTGLYTVGATTKVVLDDASVIFYTDVKEGTDDFKELYSYDKTSITTKSFGQAGEEVYLASDAYLVPNADGKTYTLVAAMVGAPILGSNDGKVTYVQDGTLVLYAPAASAVVYEGGKKYYEYTFMDNETITNKEPVVDTTKTTEEAQATEAGNFYAWSETAKKYVPVARTGDSFKEVTLDTIHTSFGLLEYNGDESMVSITDDVTIWGLVEDEKGNDVYDEYKTLTVSELADMLDDLADAGKKAKAILVSVQDLDDEYQLDTIIVEIYEEDEEGELVSVNNLLFPSVEA